MEKEVKETKEEREVGAKVVSIERIVTIKIIGIRSTDTNHLIGTLKSQDQRITSVKSIQGGMNFNLHILGGTIPTVLVHLALHHQVHPHPQAGLVLLQLRNIGGERTKQ